MTDEPGKPKNEINWNEILQKIMGKKGGVDGGGGGSAKSLKPANTKKIVIIVVAIAVVLWGLTGIYTVDTGEEGVVKRFGKHTETTSPGLNYHLPWPIDSVSVVNVQEIRTAEIGFRTTSTEGNTRDVIEESHMLTEDRNIVDADLVVQYKVNNSANFLFNVKDPEIVLHSATEVALRGVVGQSLIDQVLTDGRTEVQANTKESLQKLLDEYNSGIELVLVELQATAPPAEVKDAFDDVNRAEQDREKLIREAEGYAADRVPKARGEAQKMVLEATAYKEQRRLNAEGDAAKFLIVLREHEVPAAFQVLAEAGVPQAQEELLQIGFIAGKSTLENLLAGEGLTDEIAAEASGMTRQTLANILTRLGVISETQNAESLTGQALLNAFEQLSFKAGYQGIDEKFGQAYDEAIRLTRERLYLETMEQTLSNTEITIIDPAIGGSLTPLYPIKSLTGSDNAQEVK